MSALLTTASVLQCVHGGKVTAAPGSSRVKAGAPVLRPSDTFVIAGCSNQPDVCVVVEWPAPGGKAKADGGTALRDTDTGLCKSANGLVQCNAVVGTTQSSVSGS